MESRKLLEVLSVAERLKDATRHCYTSGGRRESVAEHSWRMTLMAYLVSDEFPEADLTKLLKMCLIHDLGEAFTGDIAAFDKTKADTQKEDELYRAWVAQFPAYQMKQFQKLLDEMEKQETKEAKLYKALDKMEAVIQHNEADIGSWLPLEYDLQLSYGEREVQFSKYLQELKETVNRQTIEKIKQEKNVPTE